MNRYFNVSEIDAEINPIGKHEFYQQYLSKSMPLVVRNDAKEWPLYKEIHTALRTGVDALEDYIQGLFSRSYGAKTIEHLLIYSRIVKNATDDTW